MEKVNNVSELPIAEQVLYEWQRDEFFSMLDRCNISRDASCTLVMADGSRTSVPYSNITELCPSPADLHVLKRDLRPTFSEANAENFSKQSVTIGLDWYTILEQNGRAEVVLPVSTQTGTLSCLKILAASVEDMHTFVEGKRVGWEHISGVRDIMSAANREKINLSDEEISKKMNEAADTLGTNVKKFNKKRATVQFLDEISGEFLYFNAWKRASENRQQATLDPLHNVLDLAPNESLSAHIDPVSQSPLILEQLDDDAWECVIFPANNMPPVTVTAPSTEQLDASLEKIFTADLPGLPKFLECSLEQLQRRIAQVLGE